jgi:hypothetical protein
MGRLFPVMGADATGGRDHREGRTTFEAGAVIEGLDARRSEELTEIH